MEMSKESRLLIACLIICWSCMISSFVYRNCFKNDTSSLNGKIEGYIEAKYPNAAIQLEDNTFIYQGKLYEYTTNDKGINHIYEANKKIVQ